MTAKEYLLKYPLASASSFGLMFIAAFTGYWYYSTLYPSTDNAYVQANMIQITSQVSGKVSSVSVTDNEAVTKGQLLFTLDGRQYKYAVEKANAILHLTEKKIAALKANIQAQKNRVEQARATYDNAEQQWRRLQPLLKTGETTRAEGDRAAAAKNSALAAVKGAQNTLVALEKELGTHNGHAQIEQAKADLHLAKLNLAHTRVFATTAGRLANVHLHPGAFVQAGAPLFTLIDTASWWVSANFKETQLTRLKQNQQASVRVDMYPNIKFTGSLSSISPASGTTFSLLPAENGSGNWVKVTQRFPVKIQLNLAQDTAHPLRVGASCSVTLNTTQAIHGKPLHAR